MANISSNNLTSLYGGGKDTVITTTVVPNVAGTIPSKNLTTLYSGAGAPVTATTSYGNANVERFLNAGTDGGNTITNIVASGNITADYYFGNGAFLTGIDTSNTANYANYANFAGEAFSVDVSNVVGIGNIATIDLDGNSANYLNGVGVWGPITGNISSNFAAYAGNVTVNAQPNITSLGNLVSLTINDTFPTDPITRFTPNGISITTNAPPSANISYYEQVSRAGTTVPAKVVLRTRGNTTTTTSVGASDTLEQNSYYAYNGNTNALAATYTVRLGGTGALNTSANALYTGAQFSWTTGNPYGDWSNTGNGALNSMTFNTTGRLSITPGSRPTTGADAGIFNLSDFGNSTGAQYASGIYQNKARGDSSDPLSVEPNDEVAKWRFVPNNGNATTTVPAQIRTVVDSSYVANNAYVPMNISIEPTTDINTRSVSTFYGNGLVTFPDSVIATGNLTVANANLGNLAVANFFSGDGGLLSNIAGANVAGAVTVRTEVKNTSGGILTKGTPVYVTGTVGASPVVEVSASRADTASTMGCIGLLEDTLAIGATGYSVSVGALRQYDTSLFASGDELYVGATGGITNVRPTNNNIVQSVGVAGRISSTSGSVEVNIWNVYSLPNLENGNIWVGDSGNGYPAQVVLSTSNVGNSNFANYAGNVTVAAQPNITTTGNLLYLNVRDSSNTSGTIRQFAPNTVTFASPLGSNVAYDLAAIYSPNASANVAKNIIIRSRGNVASPATVVNGDRIVQHGYFVYNGNTNILAASETLSLSGTVNSNSNAVYTGAQWTMTVGNPAGDIGNTTATSGFNQLALTNSGAVTINPGTAPNVSLGQTTSSLLITNYGQSTANLVRAGGLNFQKSRGNRDNVQTVQPGDHVGVSYFTAYSNGAYQSSNVAQYRVVVDSSYVANDAIVPLYHQFQTVANVGNVATFLNTTFYSNGRAEFPGNVYAGAGQVTAGNLNVVGTSYLGAVGNITITGGSSGYVLSTDGSGGLSWVAQSGGSGNGAGISNGTSNVNIATVNGNVTVGVAGNANVATFTGTGLVLGNLTLNSSNVQLGANSGVGSPGSNRVAIGANAGSSNSGSFTVSIGDYAGLATQGDGAIAIGYNSGFSGMGNSSIAIGANAGTGGTGLKSIMIGDYATASNANVISIGANAGRGAGSQGNNSIVLNATGANLQTTTANTFTVKPIRSATGGNVLYYDSTTGEITFSTLGNLSLVQFQETVLASANTSTSITPDVATGTIFRYTANNNFTFNSLTNAVAGSSATVIITQDGTGSRLLSSTMKFAGASKTLSTAAGAIDIIGVFYDGSTYYASLTKGYA